MRTLFVCLSALAFLLLAQPSHGEKPVAPEHIPGTVRVSAERAVELILASPELVVIDARHPDEHAKGHVEGAVSLLDADMTRESLARHVADKDSPVLFYCNGVRCPRSSRACKKAVKWGYRRVYWMRGGWNEWLDKGLPVEK